MPRPVATARLALLAAGLGATLACSGSKPSQPAAPAEAPPAPVEALGDLSPAALDQEADKKTALVPSPLEAEAALVAAGIDTTLSSLVPADRQYEASTTDPDRIAMRTGVVLADLLLTTANATDAVLVGHLTSVRDGMVQLKQGGDIVATLDDMIARVQAGALDRAALLKEFEELSQVVIPELEFEGGARIVPLIQAGTWTAGANLVARAVMEKGKPTAGEAILKQPAVVAYFAQYAKDNTPDSVPSEVSTALDSMLARLMVVASKPDALSQEDVEIVADVTIVMISLL